MPPKPDPLKSRLRKLVTELMLIPGLSGYEGRVRRYLAAELKSLGIASRADRLGNLIATIAGDSATPSVMLFAHMDQLGLIVRRIEANGLIRVERLGGVPEKALPAQAVLFCIGRGGMSPASSPARAITRPRRRRSTGSFPIRISTLTRALATPPTCSRRASISARRWFTSRR